MSDPRALPLVIWIPSKPVPKARARTTRTGITYTPKATAQYETWVRWVVQAAMSDARGREFPIEGPVGVTILYAMSHTACAITAPGLPVRQKGTNRPDNHLSASSGANLSVWNCPESMLPGVGPKAA